MLLSVVLSYLRRRAATGHQQEEETRRRHAYILRVETSSWQRSHVEGQLSVTCRRHGPGRERQQSSAPGRWRSPWWCNCSKDFLVNFNMWDRESPWSLPRPRVSVCAESLTAQGSRTILLCQSAAWAGSVSQCTLRVPHAHTHTNTQQCPSVCPLSWSV